jgi:hypothetical protein
MEKQDFPPEERIDIEGASITGKQSGKVYTITAKGKISSRYTTTRFRLDDSAGTRLTYTIAGQFRLGGQPGQSLNISESIYLNFGEDIDIYVYWGTGGGTFDYKVFNYKVAPKNVTAEESPNGITSVEEKAKSPSKYCTVM